MERRSLARERVYDPVLRLIHAWNALLVVLLLLTGQLADLLVFSWEVPTLWRLHLWLGYGLVIGVVGRLLWGLVGPPHARWTALWHPGAWLTAVRRREFFTVPEAYGHHPLASGVYLAVYGMLVVMVGTGLALAGIDQNSGPLYGLLGHDVMLKGAFRAPHEWLQYAVLAFVVAHLAMLVRHERRHGIPVAQAMLSGYQYIGEETDA